MFNVSTDDKQQMISFDFSSDMNYIERVIDEIDMFLKPLEGKDSRELNIVLRELLINAVEHGNQSDMNRNVKCVVTIIENERLKITVEDEGDGFDYQGLDLSLPEDPLQARKRGLPLINAFSDELEFTANGSSITVYVSLKEEESFKVESENEWHQITPSGNITASNVDRLRNLLVKLHEGGARYFRFDFKNVQHIDSLGLSVMVVLSKMLKNDEQVNGLELTNVNQMLTNLFQLTRIDQEYRIVS